MALADHDIESRLAATVTDLDPDSLDEPTTDTVERAFVDTVGVTLAGFSTEVGESVSRWLPDGGLVASGKGDPEHALALGAAGHALDYDDLSWAIDGHPSVVLVPPILALAGETDASGRDAIAAYVAGFEVMSAVAAPISPEHYEAGWHATATFGTFGAAAAAAYLLDLTPGEARNALCIAASTPAGLKRNFGSMTKPLHAGFAARSGFTAALVARDGATADAEAIGGEGGFLDLYGQPRAVEPPERRSIDERGIHTKAYPCCYFTHTAIAATQSLASDHGIGPADVEAITVEASQGAADALAHSDPGTGLEAKFSMEYAVASALARDRVDLATFEEPALSDPVVRRLRERVSFRADSDLGYDTHTSTVRIETTGETVERRQENPPGTHGNPLSADRRRAKFLDCATRTLDRERAERLYEDLGGFASARSLSSLLDVSEVL
ncbi:MmgE/PrpD family protein [Halalkalicoccus sp. NIPERK01]|uniref:MmgE/PrpD family protein n=1 Tax=Halalkalicoccus sp. NIPERK01 TaxID=3053469 RepID=UPI00256EFB4F|nr:MmgE/PrpD family protein [Halalkalicoccus sp. NIPERK01]MDL5363674.1 MmgE/PrpD family protein [Halalkalicoccus sp. NIPERK01]